MFFVILSDSEESQKKNNADCHALGRVLAMTIIEILRYALRASRENDKVGRNGKIESKNGKIR